jgi:hypothetical protein
MTSNLYILEGHEVRRVRSLMKWGRWFETAERRVAFTTLLDGSDVSTVFLGVDHQWREGPPVLFETCVFYDPLTADTSMFNGKEYRASEVIQRYSTWEQAERGHAAFCERYKAPSPVPQPEKEPKE